MRLLPSIYTEKYMKEMILNSYILHRIQSAMDSASSFAMNKMHEEETYKRYIDDFNQLLREYTKNSDTTEYRFIPNPSNTPESNIIRGQVVGYPKMVEIEIYINPKGGKVNG